MTSKNSFFIGVGFVVIIVGAGFLLWPQGPAQENMSENAPDFIPPVYGTDGDEVFITLPLDIGSHTEGGLSSRQNELVNEFKKLILARITSKVPLKESERTIISGSISIGDTRGLFIANQRVLKFTDEELQLITKALEQ